MDIIKELITLINQDIDSESESKSFTVMLRWSYCLMLLYFLLYGIYSLCFDLPQKGIGILPWILIIDIGLYLTYHISSHHNFLLYAAILIIWSVISVITLGWDCSGQHFMIPLLIMCFFSVHDSLMYKFCFTGGLIFLRIWMYLYSQSHTPVLFLTQKSACVLQILNSFYLFFSMSIVCMIFSSTIQQSEKKLMIYNQKLQALASTDPLTKLPNRRYMLNLMEKHVSAYPQENFCIALGDIDLFKKVNDTRGHNCGDDVLKSVAELFIKHVGNRGHICRWGGEEFFFFFPKMNLDAASSIMNDLDIAIARQPMYDHLEQFYITMTFGVEEYDYHSDIATLINRADEKLYYGKEHGRNQVVF